MKEPPSSAQGEPNPAGDQPDAGADTPPPRRRSRKLRLAGAAFGLLLVAFMGFLLVGDRGADDSIRIHLEGTRTNDMGEQIAWFAVTNVGKTEITICNFFIEFKSNGTWMALAVPEPDMPDVAPGKIALFTNQIPPEAEVWRVPFLWAEQPSKVQFFRAWLKLKASTLFGGTSSSSTVSIDLLMHEKYSAEFTR